ncbi:thioredoxin family protein [Aliikangiella marina]|uniref:Thioredoxin family protein n=1 Tax=Aliikangiella marina TaxID=1712262 RepID=A0A545T6G7_9GAMM|nr:thioredoxin family protein [Aliikangiella marina]TQV72813.1 thioredoxin family protein [Aliikangiella marina]
MSLTPSNMLPLGTVAPDFKLLDPRDGQLKTLSELKGAQGTLIMFVCNHCPFVVHIESAMADLGREYADKAINFVAISANDVIAYPQDSPEKMAQKATELDYRFPYLYDESQETARAYQAACTPDFFLFDGELRCVYRGRFDGSTPGNGVAVTGSDIKAALNALESNQPIEQKQYPSMGCNIKWR